MDTNRHGFRRCFAEESSNSNHCTVMFPLPNDAFSFVFICVHSWFDGISRLSEARCIPHFRPARRASPTSERENTPRLTFFQQFMHQIQSRHRFCSCEAFSLCTSTH